MAEPRRFISARDRRSLTPVHAVWEITLACDLKCLHCGSRAGPRRPRELSTEECLDLVAQLARLGTRAVTLIGGEAYLRRDWVEIVRACRAHGIDCTLQTGGLHLTEERIDAAVAAGLQGAGLSIDGLADVHDLLRGVPGSFAAAFKALRLLRERGLPVSVNTQITTATMPQLRELLELLIEAGVGSWQVQLTVAMGRAADHPELLLQPYQLLELMPLLADLYREGLKRGLLMQPGNNIGYFGPYESLWRGSGDERVHWTSCNAGQNSIGIEADGTIKGCPSLPTAQYSGGNIRDLTLEDIWRTAPELSFTRTRTEADLWGFCRDCYYADVCRAGCTWTAHVLFGRAGNNPYCHHRALELSRKGLRERLRLVEPAPGVPFDHARFELVQEPLDGSGASGQVTAGNLVQISPLRKNEGRPGAKSARVSNRPRKAPAALTLCRGCKRYVLVDTTACPFCGGDVESLASAHAERLRAARRLSSRLRRRLRRIDL
jgi:Y-X(10)_GDL-associated radical SAM protein